jgi:hypothetical protein
MVIEKLIKLMGKCNVLLCVRQAPTHLYCAFKHSLKHLWTDITIVCFWLLKSALFEPLLGGYKLKSTKRITTGTEVENLSATEAPTMHQLCVSVENRDKYKDYTTDHNRFAFFSCTKSCTLMGP